MEMSWMETLQLLGLDLMAGVALGLFILDLVEHALHSAWHATQDSFRPARPARPARSPARIGAPRHV